MEERFLPGAHYPSTVFMTNELSGIRGKKRGGDDHVREASVPKMLDGLTPPFVLSDFYAKTKDLQT